MTFGILALGFPVSPGVPCFGGFGGFCSLWGLTVSLSSLFFPILMHSLGDVWASWPWGSLFRRFWRVLQPLGAHSLTFFPILMHSLGDVWHPGRGVHFLPYILPYLNALMHSLGDVWHPGPGVPCFGGFGSFAAFGGSQSHFLPYSSLS